MAITSDDIKLYASNNGLGGSITATELVSNTLHNLFDAIGSDEAVLGDTEYRCIYVKNTHTTLTLYNASMSITAATIAPETTLSIGVGTSAINGTEQSVNNETTAPTGIAFESNVDTPISLGDLPPLGTKAVWLKREVTAGAAALSNDTSTISVSGDTAG